MLREPVITNLKNHLLVATAELNGSFFERAVIYMANQSSEGAMGLVINNPLPEVKFADIAKSMGIEQILAAGVNAVPNSHYNPQVFRGGPVENTRGFVLHSRDYALTNTVQLAEDLALSAQAEIVADMAHGRGPRQVNFCLGYAGWSAGQLEAELHSNSWLVVPASNDLLFKVPPQDRYMAATAQLGLTALNFPTTIGLA